MKKMTSSLTLLFALTSLFTACSKSEKNVIQTSTPVTLVMAEVNPEDSICGRMDAVFKKKVEELSNGQIIIDVQYSGILGDEKQIINLMISQDNAIQIARGPANLSAYGAEKSRLLSIPYTFSSAKHFWNFASSQTAQELLNEPYEKGIGLKGLCYAEEGFRNFFSTVPISTTEDLKGRTMRVSGQTLNDLALSLKAAAIQVPFTDLYMSLQTGAVEVAEQPITNYLTNSLYQVAPYMILDRHMLGAVQIFITAKAWDNLTPEQQEILQDAATYAQEYCSIISEEEETSAALKLLSEGVQITEVTDISEWQKACKNIIQESTQDYQELYQKILSYKE